MPPELPVNYYLDNVLTLFAHVAETYGDILEPGQAEFLERFDALGEDARKLCIRLLNRRGDWFRAGKLGYPEIASLDAAIAELDATPLLDADAEIDPADLLALFTRAELIDAAGGGALARYRRAEIEAALLAGSDPACFERLRASDRLLRINCREPYLMCQMLFFGNLNQSMTDFVLRDLGLYQFEAYTIDRRHRPYRDVDDIRAHWLLSRLAELYQALDLGERETLDQLFALLPERLDPDAPAYRGAERLRYEIARQYERLDALDTALELYASCALPPSRERRARILDRQGEHARAFEACLGMLDDPLDDAEIQFASQFAARLAGRHGFALPDAAVERRVTHRPPIEDLELEPQSPVERAVADHYNREAGAECCYYVENSLFNGVLGLLLWDVIFAPLPGAFFNPFQHRPADFYSPDFRRRRRAAIDAAFARIEDGADLRRIVRRRWREKQGLMNPLVNWPALSLELIELALARIEYPHWQAIFRRILRDLRNNRAGFPDLVHFPPEGGYCLVEVKGPGDALQQNQRRWMQYFEQHGIPHRLARVTWSNG